MNFFRKGSTMRSKKGFTLIEMMITITIIACMATIITPDLIKHLDRAENSATKMSMKGLTKALKLYCYHTGDYPTTVEGLDALNEDPATLPATTPGWAGPYLTVPVTPTDAWGNDWVYTCPGVNNTNLYDLQSYGLDEADGGGDDIANY